MMNGKGNGISNLGRRSSGLDTTLESSESLGISNNTDTGYTNTSDFVTEEDLIDFVTEEDLIDKEVNFNIWVEGLRQGYINFILKIKEYKFPFFNAPLAESKAFWDLVMEP